MAGGDRASADETLVTLLASGSTRQAAAARVGVGERTVYRRLENPAFRAKIAEARADMLARTSAMLTAAGMAAAETLIRLLRADADAIKLASATRIIELAGKLRTDLELVARIAALEEATATTPREEAHR